MRRAKLPTACTTSNGLVKQWAKALAGVESVEKEPFNIWPPTNRPAVPEDNWFIKSVAICRDLQAAHPIPYIYMYVLSELSYPSFLAHRTQH
jgi:hypothetical protein